MRRLLLSFLLAVSVITLPMPMTVIGQVDAVPIIPLIITEVLPVTADPDGTEPIILAVIDGPTESIAGELVVFDASGSVGTGYDWLVSADHNTTGLWRVFEDGRYLAFASPREANYRIVLSVAIDGQSNVVSMILKNGEVDPDPDDPDDPDDDDPDDPDPDDPPLPTGKWQVVIVYEQADIDNYPSAQVSIIKGLNFRDKLVAAGHKLLPGGIVDQHAVTRDGKVPPTIAPYVAAAKGKTLPQICVSPMKGGIVKTFPLQADAAAVLKFLNGGK